MFFLFFRHKKLHNFAIPRIEMAEKYSLFIFSPYFSQNFAISKIENEHSDVVKHKRRLVKFGKLVELCMKLQTCVFVLKLNFIAFLSEV